MPQQQQQQSCTQQAVMHTSMAVLSAGFALLASSRQVHGAPWQRSPLHAYIHLMCLGRHEMGLSLRWPAGLCQRSLYQCVRRLLTGSHLRASEWIYLVALSPLVCTTVS